MKTLSQIAIITAVMSFIFAMSGLSSFAEEEFPFLGQVLVDRVNVRAGQNKNFEKIDVLRKGQEVVVVGRSYEWYKIALVEGADNFVSADYVQKKDGETGVVSGKHLNIRSGAGTKFSVIGKVQQGETVRILATEKGWYKIAPVEGNYGWLLAKYITFKSAEMPLPATKIARIFSDDKSKDSKAGEPAKILAAQATSAPPKREPLFITGAIEIDSTITIYGKTGYKLVDETGKAYRLEASDRVLENFIAAKVRIEGELKELPPVTDNFSPILKISKINLIL